MTTHADRIELNPNIMLGKPVIRGTRIKVELILRRLAEGATQADLLDAYPNITVDDIRGEVWVPCMKTSNAMRLQFRTDAQVQALRAAAKGTNAGQ